MAVFEVESWLVAEGMEEKHAEAMRGWLKFVGKHRELFKDWKSVRYFVKYIAGDDTDQHFVVWECSNTAACTSRCGRTWRET